MKKSSAPQNNGDSKTSGWFRTFANKTSVMVGNPRSFFSAVVIILVWAAVGPLFGFSDTWQLVIKHGDHHRHFSHRFLNSEHAKPRRQGDSSKTGRTDLCREGRAK